MRDPWAAGRGGDGARVRGRGRAPGWLVPVACAMAAWPVASPARQPEPGDASAPAVTEREDDGPLDGELDWVTPAVSAPRVTQHVFASEAAKTRVSYHLYQPRAYQREPGRRFPVVYWLHGSGGGLRGIPTVARRFDEAIEAGTAPPALVVFVNGLREGMYVDWHDGSAPIETMIVEELVPHVDATWRTIATRAGRVLDGFSMGGYGAARLGFKYPETFRGVSIVGAGPLQDDLLAAAPRAGRRRAEEVLRRVYGGDPGVFRRVSPRTLAAARAETIAAGSLVRLVVGDADETFANNRDFHHHLDALGIPHTWTVVPGVGHDPAAVVAALGDEQWAFYRAAFAAAGEDTADEDTVGTAADDGAAPRAITLAVGDVARRALVVNAPPAGTTRPAVIVLHGGMGSAERMRAMSGFDAVARRHGFMVAYGEGTDFGGGRHAWNTGFLLRRQVGAADDIAYLDALLDALERDHGADPARIFMTGGSNGGMMTFVYAVARPRRLAAIAPVVATMFRFDDEPEVPLPVLIVNGAKDREVPLAGGMSDNILVRRGQAAPFKPLSEVVAFWVRVNRSDAAGTTVVDGSVTTTTHAAGPGGAVTEFVVDGEGGHGWPGSRSQRDDNAPIGSFQGAERVWRFFSDKSRRSAD